MPGARYTVLVNPWGEFAENICECQGYEYRGECAHQKIAHQKLCRWSQTGVRTQVQTEAQIRLMECPRCGGRTMWAFKPLEDGDSIAQG